MLSRFRCVQIFVNLWTVACQAGRQEHWDGLPCPPPGDFIDPGIKPMSPVSPALQTDSLPTKPPGKPTCCWSKVKWSRSVVSDSLWPHGLQPTRLLSPWDSPGKSTGVGCHFLLQGIFPTQGSNLGLPHHRQTLYRLSYQGTLLYWIAQI